MKPALRKLCAALAASGLVLAAFLPAVTPSASAAAQNWQFKSVSIAPRWADDFTSDSFRQSVRNAKDMGVNSITLVIPYHQSDDYSSDVARGSNTPSDATLGAAIDFIHGEGLKVILKPHVDTYAGGWRGLIQAHDRDAWYQNYGQILNQIGAVAEDHNAEMIVVGSELIGMASSYRDHDNTQRWEGMIASLREHYSGLLTYSANWGHGNEYTNEFEHIQFWSSLDYIGISAYFEFHNDGSVQSIKDAWRPIDENQVSTLQSRYGKPVLFTEVGYRSVDNGHVRPWDYGAGGNYNPGQQSNAYQALFEYWNERPYFSGLMIWDWSSDPNHGGEGDTGYTLHNKPTEGIAQEWFTQGGSGGSDPPPSDGWSVTSSPVTDAREGSAVTIPVSVSNPNGTSNVVIDFEIYDSGGSRVFQHFFEGQSVPQGGSAQYAIQWTPNGTGRHILKAGIFTSDWSSNVYWNDSVQFFDVVSPNGNPPPDPDPDPGTGSYQTDIWWPSDGAAVNGTQPFKAMLQGISVSDYSMYWRVDGGGLVEMHDSDVDYPHKEFMTDLSGWTWRGEGPYLITFVSKNGQGEIISEKSVNIYVR